MQLTGRSCVVCDQAIVVEGAAEGCEACDLAFHRACLSPPDVCPECARPFGETAAVVATEAVLKGKQSNALARRTVVRALITIVAFDALVAGFMLTGDSAKSSETFIAAGNLMLNGALAYAIYRKSNVARLVLGVLAGLSVIGIIALGWNARSSTMAMLLIALGLVRLGAAGTLVASENAREWTGAR